jgi:hypothetical protein
LTAAKSACAPPWASLVHGVTIKRSTCTNVLSEPTDVEGAVALFDDWQHEHVERFIAYLAKHRHRIINYSYYQSEGISIGSGEVESTVKQIGRRVKMSGAQWNEKNVPQVLSQRCAYLNGRFSR